MLINNEVKRIHYAVSENLEELRMGTRYIMNKSDNLSHQSMCVW